MDMDMEETGNNEKGVFPLNCDFFFPESSEMETLDELRQQEDQDQECVCDSFTASDSVNTSSCTETDSTSETPKTSRISFCEKVNIRYVLLDEDSPDGDEENVDAVVDLKEGDFTEPTIEPVVFDEKEEAIRAKLVGCIRAEKRKHHDFGRMYGCGRPIGRSSILDDLDNDPDVHFEYEKGEKGEMKKIRVIEGHTPSSFWFTPIR